MLSKSEKATTPLRASKPADVEALRVAIRLWRASIAGSPLQAPQGVERLRAELDEIVQGTERAAIGILDAAEQVDQAAQTLSAALQRDHERGLANDIREQIAKIFETCHFQDMAGQRATKVSQALNDMSGCAARTRELCDALEERNPAALLEALTWDGFDPQSDRSLLNGPRLAGDPGHCGQSQIDVIFGS